MATADENFIARQMLSVLEKRVNLLEQRAPSTTPSAKSQYILMLPPLEHDDAVGNESPLVTQARLGSDAAFVVQKILLVGQAPLMDADGSPAAGNLTFFDLIDRASGGRSIFTSQQNNTPTQRFPITHFANTTPANSRGACYSAWSLSSEYLLARGAVVEARLFRAQSEEEQLRIALAGYKVYG